MLNRLEELAWISRCKLFRDENAFASLVGAWSGRIRKFLLMQTGGDGEEPAFSRKGKTQAAA